MANKKDTKAAPTHTSSSRTEVMPDGLTGAWVTLDGAETWIGSFGDERLAQFDIQGQLASAEGRWAAEAAAAEAAETTE